MTHFDHDLPADPALDALFSRTLGKGGLSANRKRRHRETLALAANAAAGTLPRTNTFSTTVESNPAAPVGQPPTHGTFREWLEFAAVLVVFALVLGGVALYQTAFSGEGDDEAPLTAMESSNDFTVYVRTNQGTNPSTLAPIDRDTLEDRDDLPELETSSSYTLSDDGSTLVRIEYDGPTGFGDRELAPDEVTIIVQDGLDGPEHLRFHPVEQAGWPILSDDGSRLLLQSRLEPDSEEPPRWHVYNTLNGNLAGTVERDSRIGSDRMFLSADATKLIRAWVAPSSSTNTPEPLRVMVYDIATGEEIDRLVLDDIPAGAWSLDPVPNSPMTDLIVPGVALSPDGRSIAIAHADTRTVTLVDAENLTIENTLQLAGSGDKAVPWVEREPWATTDRMRDQTEVRAEFSPDGRYLYVYGYATSSDESGRPVSHGFGLTLVDLEQGAVLARAYEGERVGSVTVAPDGHNIYVTTHTGSDDMPQLVQRLDAHTLEVLTERRFDDFSTIVIDPSPPEPPEDEPDDIAPTPPPGDSALDPVYMVLAQQQPHMPPERSQMLQPMHPTTLEPLPGKEPFDFGHHYTYAFSPDGQTLAAIIWPSSTSNRGGRLHLINLESWTSTATNVTFDDAVGNLVFSPDSVHLYWNELTPRMPGHEQPGDYVLYRYDVDSGEHFKDTIVRLPDTFVPVDIELLDGGRRMAVFGSPAIVSVDDTPDPPQVVIVDLESPTSSTDAIDAVIDLNGVQNWQHPPVNEDNVRLPTTYLPGLAWDTERDRLYIIHTDEDAVTVVDLAQGTVIAQQTFGEPELEEPVHRYAAISDDGTRLYAMGSGFQIIDTAALTELDRLDTSVAEFTVLPGGDQILLHVVETVDNPDQGVEPGHSLVLYDSERLTEAGRLEIESVFPLHGVSSDGRYAYLSKRETMGNVPGLEVRAIALETMEIVAAYSYDDAWYANFLRQ